MSFAEGSEKLVQLLEQHGAEYMGRLILIRTNSKINRRYSFQFFHRTLFEFSLQFMLYFTGVELYRRASGKGEQLEGLKLKQAAVYTFQSKILITFLIPNRTISMSIIFKYYCSLEIWT